MFLRVYLFMHVENVDVLKQALSTGMFICTTKLNRVLIKVYFYLRSEPNEWEEIYFVSEYLIRLAL